MFLKSDTEKIPSVPLVGGLPCLAPLRQLRGSAHAAGPLAAMKVRDLNYVMASAAAGNLTGAARSLGISASTISRRVSRIEDELGLAIFERGHKGVRLTTGGRAVLLHARRAAAELEGIRLAAKRNGTGIVGEVRLGLRMAPIGEPILDLLSRWRQNCAEVQLTISEMNERDLAVALEELSRTTAKRDRLACRASRSLRLRPSRRALD